MCFLTITLNKVKVKFFHTRYRALFPGLIPVYTTVGVRGFQATTPRIIQPLVLLTAGVHPLAGLSRLVIAWL